ncbi:MAG: hypothetical protein D6815_11525, partial [Candidatus Dadabacteria bacterium]
EILDVPTVTVAKAVELAGGGKTIRVTRVTPDGDQVVEVDLPAVVTISNELGDPRYPTGIRTLKAQRVKPEQIAPESLGLESSAITPRVTMERQWVEQIVGNCEFIEGDSAEEVARKLVERLRADGVIG